MNTTFKILPGDIKLLFRINRRSNSTDCYGDQIDEQLCYGGEGGGGVNASDSTDTGGQFSSCQFLRQHGLFVL